jgi:hypothetical protein
MGKDGGTNKFLVIFQHVSEAGERDKRTNNIAEIRTRHLSNASQE